ncbi:MAG: PIN domain-containing protein [Isosphaeraceae bacterium]|jgi:predicted nucleic acid-binding protein
MFLDTSGLHVIFHSKEKEHEAAVSLFGGAGPKLTHSYILTELVALAIARGLSRAGVLSFVRSLLAHPEVQVVWVDQRLHLEAMELLEHRPDKSWSLCDAVSFVLMSQHRVTDALTTDHHFEQAGFVRLLRP